MHSQKKTLVRSVLFYFIAPVAATAALILAVPHMSAFVGADLRQFDPETAMTLRLFGLVLLGLVGVYLIARRIGEKRGNHG